MLTQTVDKIRLLLNNSDRLPRQFVQERRRFVEYTPDWWQLQQYEWQLLFVYGEEKRGLLRNELVVTPSENELLYDAYSEGDFSLINKDLGDLSFPIALHQQFKSYPPAPMLKVRGEIYRVRPRTFIDLDNCKLNGVQFIRIRANVYVYFHRYRRSKSQGWSDPTNEKTLLHVWMYVGIPNYWNELIDNGYQYKAIQPTYPKNLRLPGYYDFKGSPG